MKYLKSALLIIFICLLHVTCYAQESQPEPERGSVLPGFIITLQGDTVQGYLLNINLWLNQKMTFFYTDPDDRKGRIKYTPKEIMAYQVGPRYYESMKHSFSYSTRSQNFILRKIDGPIKYYVWYYDPDQAKLAAWDKMALDDLEKAILFEENELSQEDFARKGKEETLTAFSFKFLVKFAKNMSEFVKDDVELAKKIAAKTPGYQNINIEAIIREYNDWYLNNSQSYGN
jgi:hypothetical protein